MDNGNNVEFCSKHKVQFFLLFWQWLLLFYSSIDDIIDICIKINTIQKNLDPPPPCQVRIESLNFFCHSRTEKKKNDKFHLLIWWWWFCYLRLEKLQFSVIQYDFIFGTVLYLSGSTSSFMFQPAVMKSYYL